MSVDSKIIEVLKNKIRSEDQDNSIAKILEAWLDEIDQGKKDIDQDIKIKKILDKINV